MRGMKGKWAPNLVFYGLCAIMTIVCIVSFVQAVSCINKPFQGFLVYKWPYVGSMGNSEWPGPRAGLNLMDRIISADGMSIASGPDVTALARQKAVGTPIQYTIQSRGQARTVVVPTIQFNLRDFFLVFLIPFICGTAIFCIGAIAYVLKPNVSTSWVFFFMCLFLGIYIVSGVEIQSTYRLVPLHYLIITFMPAAMFHMGLVFPQRKKIIIRYPILEYLIYIPAVVLVLGFQIYHFRFEVQGAAWIPDISLVTKLKTLFTFTCVVALIGLLIHSLFGATSTVGKQRAKMVLFGISAAFLPTVVIMVGVHFLKLEFPWNFLPFFGVFFPASIAYSIVRHNLFDADTIIKRTVGYVVVTAMVVGAYLGLSISLNIFAEHYQLAQSQAFPILFTVGVILVFNPVRNRVQALVDRIFFRKEYNAGEIMDKIGVAMTSLLELGQILKRLVETFVEDMFISTGSVLLLNPARAEYAVAMAGGERQSDLLGKIYARNEPLLEIIEKKKRELTKYDVIEDPQYSGVCLTCSNQFDVLHASLMIPLVYQNEVIGVFSLGEKKSGKSFNREDIELFRAIASQGAVAIENARLFQENLEKQRMEEELNIARDLQMSMLPASCPEIRGFEIAASSMPAREVGGDFYDFIEMGEDKAGLVVGDVTGKSVSGALVMSSSRSVFRMLSEEKLSVGDIMVRANRRIKQDIKSGMFVALLYAVLNGRDGSVSLCSAGQTQPIHYSAARGEAVLIETEGDNFPLGILDEADYQETTMKLSPGDRVIFYTDGIVEAMNKKGEIFGFENLLEVVADAGFMDAASLLEEILKRVNDFAGGAAQHDDLTVIVVNVRA